MVVHSSARWIIARGTICTSSYKAASWISPVCWLWQSDSLLVNRNVLRGLDHWRAAVAGFSMVFLFLSLSVYLSVCLTYSPAHTHTQCSVCHYTRTHCHWGLTLGSYLSSQDCCTAVCERKPSLSNLLQTCLKTEWVCSHFVSFHSRKHSSSLQSLDEELETSSLLLWLSWVGSRKHSSDAISYVPVSSLSVRRRLLHSHGLTITKGSLSFDKCNQKMGLQLLTLSCSSPKFSKQQGHTTFLFCSLLVSLLCVVFCPRSSFLFSAAFSFLCCIAGNPRPKGRGLPLMWQRLQK